METKCSAVLSNRCLGERVPPRLSAISAGGLAAAIGLAILAAQLARGAAAAAAGTQAAQAGAWADLGARATAQYAGDGLSVTKSPSGAVWLRCIFQKLEGEATAEGLWFLIKSKTNE